MRKIEKTNIPPNLFSLSPFFHFKTPHEVQINSTANKQETEKYHFFFNWTEHNPPSSV